MSTEFEQLGPEGKRVDSAPDESYLRSPNSPLIYFGNRICPFAHRSWWAILEKGIDKFEYIHIDLGPIKPKWYAEKIYDAGTVPSIFDSGKFVGESLIVAEYFEDKYPQQGTQLLPTDAYQRAEIRTIIYFWGEKVQKVLYGLLMNSDRSKDDELKENASKVLKTLNDKFAAQSSGPYFLGQTFSLADIAIVPFLDRFAATLKHYRNFDIFADYNRLKELFEESKKRPAFQKTSQTPQFYIDGYKGYAK